MAQPILILRGGARRGLLNTSWPFEQLKVYVDRLEFSGKIIPKSDIIRLSEYRGFISTGLKIECGGGREPLIFWTWQFGLLQEALLSAAYLMEN